MTYECMTEAEYALWRQGAAEYATLIRRPTAGTRGGPCLDCPMAFRREAIAGRRCRWYKDRANGYNRRYRALLRNQVERVRRQRERDARDRLDPRRRTWRESKRRRRAA